MSGAQGGPAAGNGADALCDTLLGAGIDLCFANPGTSEMHFVAALDRKPQMRCVLALFEGVATGAADGFARMADRPAATLLHLGPGLANGIANLHNARRARTPVVNIVGDHATSHRGLDAPLSSDIASLARPVSAWVDSVEAIEAVSADACRAIEAARAAPGGVATLILPADMAWSPWTGTLSRPHLRPPSLPDDDRLDAVAARLRAARRPVMILGGSALRGEGLEWAGRLARAFGAALYAEQSSGRIERGAGRVPVRKTPNAVDAAAAAFAGCDLMLLVGGRVPVGFFAYPGKPGTGVPSSCTVDVLARPDEDVTGALIALGDRLGIRRGESPALAIRRSAAELAGSSAGALDADAVIRAVAAALPEHAIVCDETISSGFRLFDLTDGTPPHDYLPLTGGAIGIGPPLATGAAVACPDRKVVCLQADGSAMYTAQALWTQARERLDVVTVIFANRSYALLQRELRAVGAGVPGRNARRMLEIDSPVIDWVKLAEGMGVEARRVNDGAALAGALAAALAPGAQRGPRLIEAVLGR